MAALRRSVQLQKAFKLYLSKQRSVSSSTVLQAEWNKDWMPDRYPRTEAERKAAAKKYGLIPEDYKPMPDDGDAHGDYPDLPLIGEEEKNPYEDWDDPVMKRNFGEPMHIYYESIVTDKGNPARKYRFSPLTMFCSFMVVALVFMGSWFFTMPYGLVNSRYHDWYPYEEIPTYVRGQVLPSGKRQIHYTFEPAE